MASEEDLALAGLPSMLDSYSPGGQPIEANSMPAQLLTWVHDDIRNAIVSRVGSIFCVIRCVGGAPASNDQLFVNLCELFLR